jgi:ribosomal protein L37AE/L43A
MEIEPFIYGMTCAQCGDLLIAPDADELRNKRNVRHLWSCPNCDYQFETSANLPSHTDPQMRDNNMKEVFLSLIEK